MKISPLPSPRPMGNRSAALYGSVEITAKNGPTGPDTVHAPLSFLLLIRPPAFHALN